MPLNIHLVQTMIKWANNLFNILVVEKRKDNNGIHIPQAHILYKVADKPKQNLMSCFGVDYNENNKFKLSHKSLGIHFVLTGIWKDLLNGKELK